MRELFWPLLAAAPLLLAASAPAAAQAPSGPIYVVTFIEVQAASTASGLARLKQYRDGARQAEGNLEAELGQELGRANRFVLIEAWRDAAAFDAHEKDAAAARFRETLKAIEQSPPDQRVNRGLDTAPPRGAAGLLVATHVDVTPPRQAATEAALKTAASAMRGDAGNRSWDVFQQIAPRTNHFNLIAWWRSREDFERAAAAPHGIAFRATLAPMLGALYDERLYRPL